VAGETSAPVVTGIVLAGGAGRRMGGVDKAALVVGGHTLLDRVLGAAGSVCARPVVVGPVRDTAADGVRFTVEAHPGGGPVPAVAAGLAQAPEEEVPEAQVVVVLAVDFALLRSSDVRRLVAALDGPGLEAAAAADHRGRPNPLLAAYRADSLRHRVASLGPGVGAPASVLLPEETAVVELGPVATLNVNSPTDLDRAAALVAAEGRRLG
jgi:molybdopterin-guanine dinucleotide biosynthesis protein A